MTCYIFQTQILLKKQHHYKNFLNVFDNLSMFLFCLLESVTASTVSSDRTKLEFLNKEIDIKFIKKASQGITTGGNKTMGNDSKSSFTHYKSDQISDIYTYLIIHK